MLLRSLIQLRAYSQESRQLVRRANLGSMIESLKDNVPHMLTHLLPHEIISPNIILRLLPTQLPNLPPLKGYTVYASTLKTLQQGLHMFYLHPKSKISITHMSVIEPTGSLSCEEVIDNSIKNTEVAAEPNLNIQHQKVSNYTTKIKMLWKTSRPEGTPAVDGQNKILSGVFVFELDAENEKIYVFTIDNVELMDSKEEEFQGPIFGVST